MQTVISKDGTTIAYDKIGHGPTLILIAGAFQDRRAMGAYAIPLAKDFTVYAYDRRGRGDSGDTQPYAIEREIEDIDAMIAEAGGSALIFAGSSGAVLALDAVQHGSHITKLAVHEPPFVVDDSRPPVPDDILAQLKQAIKEGRRGDAAEIYLTKGAGMSAEEVAEMRAAPYWGPGVEAVAPTLVYDAEVMEGTMRGKPLPTDRWTKVTIPTLITNSISSFMWADAAAAALAALLPNATRKIYEGEEHDISPDTLAPELIKFFTA